MQLVAYGAQDIYLTGNPQITFFKVVYRRHTNFSMEAIEQTWNGTSTGADGRCTATISRNGDLVYRMYLEVGGTTANTANPGSAFIKSVELEIGGQKIDKHTGFWMEVWSELTEPNDAGITGAMTQNDDRPCVNLTKFQAMSGMGGVAGGSTPVTSWNVPLQFWFCRNPGLALPLIALQYHEVKVILDHSHNTIFTGGPTNKLWCDYIYLDTDERRRFAQVSHEYLIEQVQEQSMSTNKVNELNFNHPVKELIWAAHGATIGDAGWTVPLISRASNESDKTFQLKLNGHDRFAARAGTYFSRTQICAYHSGYGGLTPTATGVGEASDAISVYSFALKPEEHQPSGTCNFSRIDNAQLVSEVDLAANTVCFAVNYNVLRIMSGMGGLAYSN
jgi:hypothetical protein